MLARAAPHLQKTTRGTVGAVLTEDEESSEAGAAARAEKWGDRWKQGLEEWSDRTGTEEVSASMASFGLCVPPQKATQ